jgi:hypothetical protein
MTDEFEEMAKALNEALDIEENASHTQRLVTIVRLRMQALKEYETLLQLEEVTRQRDQAEQRLLDVLTAHIDFIQDAVTQAQLLQKATGDFQKDLVGRMGGSVLDDLDRALIKMREQREAAEEVDISLDPDDFGSNEIDDVDLLQLVDLEPKPKVRMDFPDTDEERIGAETTTDFVDERNRVPFSDVEVPLASDTRAWMQEMAAGGVARDDS